MIVVRHNSKRGIAGMHEPGAETKIFQSVPGTVFLQNAVWGNTLLDQILAHDFGFGGRFIVTLST